MLLVKGFEILPLCGPRCSKYTIRILFLFLALYPFHQYYYFGFRFSQWDLLLFSGVATLIFGLFIVATVHDRFQETLARLAARQALHFEAISLEKFLQRVQTHSEKWARGVGFGSAVVIFIAFVLVLMIKFDRQRALLGVGEVIGAYITGNYLGYMVGYGRLGYLLKKNQIAVKVDPNHVDGVCGLKPMGDYFFYQAMIVAIPTIFLAIWWFVFPIYPRDYTHWEKIYLWLLSPALALEVLAFIVPLWSFHQIMTAKKNGFKKKADQLSVRIQAMRQSLAKGNSTDKESVDTEQIEQLTAEYWAIENMVTWPVDLKTRKKFRVNNILLLLPLLGDISKRTIEWTKILKFLNNFM